MRCISQLELAQMIGSGAVTAPGGAGKQASDSLAKKSESVQDLTVRSSLNEASSQSVIVAVDRIFTGSRNLSGDAIVYFFTALCQVRSILYNSLENSIWSWDTFNQRYRKLPWSRKNETLSRLPEAPTTYWEHLPSLLSSSITDTTNIPLLSSHIPKDNTTTLSYRLHRAPYKYISYHIHSKSHRISQMDLWNSKKQL